MDENKKYVLLIVITMICTVIATYTFTLSIASTTANDALNDMCRINGKEGVKAVEPFSNGFTIYCERGAQVEEEGEQVWMEMIN